VKKEDLRTIKISTGLRERLKEFGKKGETYDAIIERLLNASEAKRQ